MRKLSRHLGIFLLLAQPAYSEDISGKSFLSAQPFSILPTDITFTTVMDQHFEDGSVLNKPQIQASVFGGKSTNNNKLRNYFLFNNLSQLTMNEAPASDTSSLQNIVGYNFNIFTKNENASSIITFDPVETFAGFGISARYGFKEKWWVAIQIPFMHVKRDLQLSEAELESGGGLNTDLGLDGLPAAATNMTTAFKQSGMLYGKIDGSQKKSGCGDIELLLGYDFMDRNTNYLSPFIGAILPASNKPTAEYLWEPILGNNKHFGVILGLYGHSHIYEKKDTHLWFTWCTKNQYLIQNTQKRSFDLKRGPWTRYLAMYSNSENRLSTVQTLGTAGIKTFGINIMTQDVYVTPGCSSYSVINLAFIKNKLNITLGVTAYIKESENVYLVNQWALGPEVADLVNNNCSNVLRTISSLGSSGSLDGDSLIQPNDIDFSSATNTNIFVNSIYSTVSYYNNTTHPQLYELGGSFETSKQNNSINRFTMWSKFQLTF